MKSTSKRKDAKRLGLAYTSKRANPTLTKAAKHYKAKLEYDQDGLCAICGEPNYIYRHGEVTTRLFLDHNHTTGRFRGLLCHSCNVGLGMFRDSPALLRAACSYLKQWS